MEKDTQLVIDEKLVLEDQKHITDGDIRSMFLRSNFLLGSFNFERVQAMGYCFIIIPALKRLYKGEELQEALKRHLEWFNTQPWASSVVFGVTTAMEEEKANTGNIDGQSISAMKIGLMGPLAGVGDPIFWGTVRPVLAALGASLAITGNIMGPVLFFVLINIIRLATKYFGLTYGFRKGKDIIQDVAGGRIARLTEMASIVGLFVMGALVNLWTTINIPLVVSEYEVDGVMTVTTVQSILDSILPGILPLGLTLFVAYLLRKKVSALLLILIIFAVGIVGYALGILA